MGQTAPGHPLPVDSTTRAFQTVPTAQTHRVAVAPAAIGEPIASFDVAMADWDDLLSAVKARLRQTVGGLLAPITEQGTDAAWQVRASVLDCVTALDQLHLTLSHELGRRDSACATRQRVSHDVLTALPNRSLFQARLKQSLADSELRQGLALIRLDLDDFEAIKHEHGQEAGDEVLRIVAARLVRAVRADDMVSRLGGDEFACILSNAPVREQLGRQARKMSDAVAAPMRVGALNLNIRTSIGIAVFPTDGAGADALLKSAGDAALRARHQKTSYAFFDESPGLQPREIG